MPLVINKICGFFLAFPLSGNGFCPFTFCAHTENKVLNFKNRKNNGLSYINGKRIFPPDS